MGAVAFSISSHEQTAKSAIFLYCRFSLFLGDPFFRLFRGCRSCRCAAWSWLNFSLYINIVLISFHILVFQNYCALMESRIPLRLGLWAWGLRLPLILKNRIKKMSLLFTYIVDSLYFQIICGIVY